MSSHPIITNLLQIKAIELNLTTPFLWSSGWKAPIYCDNRKAISYPTVRQQICDAFTQHIRAHHPHAEVIAGVATGAIAHASFVAWEMGLPLVYVRPEPKKHGLANQVEGALEPGRGVVVVEDLISTGASSLAAVQALRAAGVEVLGMVAIFTYGFDLAAARFAQAQVPLHTLATYSQLIEQAVDMGLVDMHGMQALRQWRQDPAGWGKG